MAKTLPVSQEDDAPPLERAVHTYRRHFDCKVHAFGSVGGNHKHPLAKGGYATATDDLAEIDRRFANPKATGFAVYPGNFIVIDLDRRDGKDGAAELDRLANEAGAEVPKTAVVKTPSGGVHLCFRIPEGVTVSSSNGKLAPGIDVRGNDGKYWAAGPGSHTPKGAYRWKRGQGPTRMADAPPWLLEAIQGATAAGDGRRRDPSEPDIPAPLVVVDDPRNVEFFRDWCAGKSRNTLATPSGEVAHPCIENERGNDTLAATGAMAHDYGLSADVALEVALEHFNPRCEPPWDADEFETHFLSGYRSATGCLGYRAPARDFASMFAPVTTEPVGEQEAQRGRDFYYLGDFGTIPDPEFLIDDVLPEDDYTVLAGPRGARKSFVALDQGCSIATGTPYHGRKVKRGRVVYFAGEGAKGTRRRVEAWFKARDLDRADFATDFALVPFTPKWDTRDGAEQAAHILGNIAEDGPIALVIIDTMRRAMSSDENSVRDVGLFTDNVTNVCKAHDAPALIVHHVGKDAGKGARGASNLEGEAAAVFYLTKATGPDAPSILKCDKMKDGEDGWSLTFRTGKINLGQEPSGKPIASLALTLESESRDTDEGPAPPPKGQFNKYASYDETAAQILKRLREPSAPRAKLASAVMGEMHPEMRESDPNGFQKMLRAYREHLARLGPTNPLWRYVDPDQKNHNGQPLSFRNPNQRGRRAPKPGRSRRALDYEPLNDGPEDA